MLQCADDSFYIGSHRGDEVETRVAEHNLGVYPQAYTFRRRPVKLVWSEDFDRFDELVARERQIKGWSRAKKIALIAGDEAGLSRLASRAKQPAPHPEERAPARVSKDEDTPHSILRDASPREAPQNEAHSATTTPRAEEAHPSGRRCAAPQGKGAVPKDGGGRPSKAILRDAPDGAPQDEERT